MSKHQKALARLCALPPAADVTWAELKGVLEHLGYTQLKGAGSRRKFYHKEKQALFCCHQPHQPAIVDKGCLVDLVDHLTRYGLINS